MKRDKFEALQDETVDQASLKENKKDTGTFQMSVYGMSRELADQIKATGESTSNFAKRAMRKLAREEGII